MTDLSGWAWKALVLEKIEERYQDIEMFWINTTTEGFQSASWCSWKFRNEFNGSFESPAVLFHEPHTTLQMCLMKYRRQETFTNITVNAYLSVQIGQTIDFIALDTVGTERATRRFESFSKVMFLQSIPGRICLSLDKRRRCVPKRFL